MASQRTADLVLRPPSGGETAQRSIRRVNLLREPLPPKRLVGVIEEGLHGPPFDVSHLPEDLASRVTDAYSCVCHSVDLNVYRSAYSRCQRRRTRSSVSLRKCC